MAVKRRGAKREDRRLARIRRKRFRVRQRDKAIRRMGGCCQICGFSDPRALQFDHITPIKRGKSTGIKRNAAASDYSYTQILRGAKGYQLLCANCHAIKTRTDDQALGLSVNYDVVELVPASQMDFGWE
jgi:5-methylcytosine-specific restriction endonuclease McrA